MNNTKIAEEVLEKGWVVIPDVLSQQQCSEYIDLLESIHARYASQYATAPNVKQVHGAGEVKIVYNLHNKNERFLPIIFDETVNSVAKQLLSEGSYKSAEPYQIAVSQGRGLVGPQPAQQMHIDSYIPGLPIVLCFTAAWALSDFIPGNGSTQFVEGSHRFDQFAEDGKTYDSVELEASAGSLILFNGAVWHGASAKTDEGTRWAMFNRYSRWFMRPSFEHSMNTPEHVFNKLSDEQKKILGMNFRSPLDEFSRATRICPTAENDSDYTLPKNTIEN